MMLVRCGIAVRLATAVTIAAACVAGSCAQAAVARHRTAACNLLTDKAGDVTTANGASFSDDSLDILSADVASNSSRLGVTIRLKALPSLASPQIAPADLYRYWIIVTFNPGAQKVIFQAQLPPNGPVGAAFQQQAQPYAVGQFASNGYSDYFIPWEVAGVGSGPVPVHGRVDATTKSIEMSVSKADLRAHGVNTSRHATANDLGAASRAVFLYWAYYGSDPTASPWGGQTVYDSQPHDVAASTSRYRFGTPSCSTVLP